MHRSRITFLRMRMYHCVIGCRAARVHASGTLQLLAINFDELSQLYLCWCFLQAKKMKVLLFGVALLFSLYAPQRVSSLPGGAPPPACATLTPSPSAHMQPQTKNIPYSIDLSPFNINGTLAYIPGNTYTRKKLTLVYNEACDLIAI